MAPRKKTILFFPFNLLSHYLRCLVLADTYDKTQYSICFLASVAYQQFVIDHGYQLFSCSQFDVQEVMDCSRRFDFSWLNEKEIERIMRAQVAAIKAFEPDMVVGDFSPTLKMASSLTGVHYVSLLNGYMTRYYAENRKMPRRHYAYRLLQALPASLADWLTNFGERMAFEKIQKPFNIIRRRHGLSPLPHYLCEMEGDLNLICDHEELFPQKNLPTTFKIIGPLTYVYLDKDDTWISELPLNKKIICVSLGSSGDWMKLKFLNDPYYSKYTIITTGDSEHVLSAAHIVARHFVNLNHLLEITNLLICHGGNGTIYQGIRHNVFMLCLSSHFEQEWNINMLEKNGYGKSADDFTAGDWKVQIESYCVFSGDQLVKN